MTRLEELRQKFKRIETGLTAEKARFARAALAIKAGVEALGPDWRCCVDVWNREPETADVKVRVGSMAGTFVCRDGDCDIGGLRALLQEIRAAAGAGNIAEGYRALDGAFAKWHPDYMVQFFPPEDSRPLPLP